MLLWYLHWQIAQGWLIMLTVKTYTACKRSEILGFLPTNIAFSAASLLNVLTSLQEQSVDCLSTSL